MRLQSTLFIVILLSSTLFAGTPMITDRPDFTESAETVPVKWVQLESGFTQTQLNKVDETTIGEILLRIGVMNDVELRVGLNSYATIKFPNGDDSGLTDTDLGLKWKFFKPGKGPDIMGTHAALLAGSSLPTGADVFTADKPEPYLKLALAWDLTESLALGSNVGYTSLAAGDNRFGEISASLSIGIGLTDKIGAYAEYFAFYPDLDGAENTSYVNGGVTYGIKNNFQLDARYGIGMNDYDTDNFLGFGVVYRWPR